MASLRGRAATLGGLLIMMVLAAPAAGLPTRDAEPPAAVPEGETRPDEAPTVTALDEAPAMNEAQPTSSPSPAASDAAHTPIEQRSDGGSWLADVWNWITGDRDAPSHGPPHGPPGPPHRPPGPPVTAPPTTAPPTTAPPTTPPTTAPPTTPTTAPPTTAPPTTVPQEPENPPGAPPPTTAPEEPEEPPGAPPPTTVPDDQTPAPPGGPSPSGPGTGLGAATAAATSPAAPTAPTTSDASAETDSGVPVADAAASPDGADPDELEPTGDADLVAANPLGVTSATGSGDSVDAFVGLLLLGLGATIGAGLVGAAWAISRLAARG